MNVDALNKLLSEGKSDIPGMFPHLDASLDQPIQLEDHPLP